MAACPAQRETRRRRRTGPESRGIRSGVPASPRSSPHPTPARRDRVQDGEVQTVQPKVLSAAPNMPGDGVGRELLQKPVVQRVRNQLARLDHEAGMESLEHGGNTAEVVSMRVRYKGEGQVSRPMTQQKGNHHAPPRIVSVVHGPGIDQNPPAGRGLQDGTVSLTNVEKM